MLSLEENCLILDVGCGNKHIGDVNVDCFPYDKTQCGKKWSVKDAKNFIIADSCHLPFRENVFRVVHGSHTIEHTHNPLLALKEFKRVCSGKVFLVFPSQYYEDTCSTHIFTWNPFTFSNLCKLVFENVSVRYTKELHNGLGGKVLVINLLYKFLNIRSEMVAVLS